MHKALGKGLDALLTTTRPIKDIPNKNNGNATKQSEFDSILITKIRPNRFQPRSSFSNEKLSELAGSIKAHGLAQPVVVRPTETPGEFELVAGQRRLKAAQIAGLSKVPAIIRELDDKEQLELSLIENLQREDLNPIDKANGIKRLINEFEITHEEAAKALGISRPALTNFLRLLSLPETIKNALLQGEISEGHARALLGTNNYNFQYNLLNRIKNDGLTVREIEKLVAGGQVPAKKREPLNKTPAPEIKELQEELQRHLNRKVEIETTGRKANSGWVKIAFYSLDDFDVLATQLKK